MPKQRLIISLLAVVAVLIAGITIYLFTRSSGLDLTTGLILIGIAVIGLIIVFSIIFLLLRSLNSKK
jgi:ABC-type enterobactin transport system permease subunit